MWHCEGETLTDVCGAESMQGNVLIRLVGYVLVQGSPSVQMTVRDDADERVWWDGMPRRRQPCVGLGTAR